jgi:replication factor A1
MNISDIKSGLGKINIEAVVISVTPIKEINKYGKNIKVSTATIKDDSGKIKLSLWNKDAEKVEKGDKVKITNGYASEFKGEKQLTAGKFGKLEVLEKGIEVEEESEDENKGEIEKALSKGETKTNIVVDDEEDEEPEISSEEDEEW